MRQIQIRKPAKKGKPQEYRIIFAQTTAEEKKKYRSLAWICQNLFLSRENNEICHGFVPDRNCVTNALEHRNKKYTLTIDLKSFFDYVDQKKLEKENIPQDLARALTVQGATRQGLSSSPMAANIAAMGIDRDILELLKDKNCVYTRYADDMTISSDDIEFLKEVRDKYLNLIVKKHDFLINHNKTRIQSSGYGRRVITGIAVDDDVHPTRKNKRKLRTLKYKASKETNPGRLEYFNRKIRGLEQFNQCKLPNPPNVDKDLNRKIKYYPKPDILSVTPAHLIDPAWIYYKNKFNLESFRIITTKLGFERCAKYLPYRVIDENSRGYRLLHFNLTDTHTRWRAINRIYLEMKNPSVAGVIHIEPVHPRCRTIQDAINYRRYGNLNKPPINWDPIQLT